LHRSNIIDQNATFVAQAFELQEAFGHRRCVERQEQRHTL
jgi:hypothetical protein